VRVILSPLSLFVDLSSFVALIDAPLTNSTLFDLDVMGVIADWLCLPLAFRRWEKQPLIHFHPLWHLAQLNERHNTAVVSIDGQGMVHFPGLNICF
jgi:hypothetical protein